MKTKLQWIAYIVFLLFVAAVLVGLVLRFA